MLVQPARLTPPNSRCLPGGRGQLHARSGAETGSQYLAEPAGGRQATARCSPLARAEGRSCIGEAYGHLLQDYLELNCLAAEGDGEACAVRGIAVCFLFLKGVRVSSSEPHELHGDLLLPGLDTSLSPLLSSSDIIIPCRPLTPGISYRYVCCITTERAVVVDPLY